MMSKLAELLHELVDAVHGNKGLTPERATELHALADEVTSAAPAESTPESDPAAPDPAPESAPPVPADGAPAA